MKAEIERTMKRWQSQKWVLDNIIRTVGVEWDQGRLAYTIALAGQDGGPDLRQVGMRVKRWADIHREFARIGRRREAMGKEAEENEHYVTAREHYFWASIFYAHAGWPILEDGDSNLIEYYSRKNECYDKVIKYAPHPMERVEIPFEGKTMPGIVHKPLGSEGKKLPFVLSVDGMDAFKELMHPLYGDKYLERGFGVLCIDGPGQGECCIRKIPVTEDNFAHAGKASIDYLKTRGDVDKNGIVLTGISMGSFWATQIAAHNDRDLKATAAALVCHEPGMNTIFNMASPSFKLRFMFMANIYDEDEFDNFAKRLTVKSLGGKIHHPFFILGGEDDELSPVQYSYDLYHELAGPKKIMVYEGEVHAMPSVNWPMMMADWLRDRADNKPMVNENIYVDITGREIRK